MVLFQIHKIFADQDGHVVVAEQEHVGQFMCGVYFFLLRALLNIFIDLETSISDLLLSFIGFNENRPGLYNAIAFPPTEKIGGTLIALIYDPNLFMNIWFGFRQLIKILQVVVYNFDALGFDQMQVKQPLDVQIPS